MDQFEEKLYSGVLLSEKEILEIGKKAKEYFANVDNVIKLDSPVTIVGDIHGQFFDLIELFEYTGKPPNVNFLFQGDYVDRGYYSLEVICLLLFLKLKYPSRLALLRGNHESKQITQVYGFYDECLRKCNGNDKIWKLITEVFDYLPLGAVVDGKILSVHGGLSPSVEGIDQFNELKRFMEIPLDGPVCDLMWSDPNSNPNEDGWKINPRGAGYFFGTDISKKFCHSNNLSFISRAHQVVMEGYQWSHDKKLVTIFSCPNYCYRCGNKAGILFVDTNSIRFDSYSSSTIRHSFDISKYGYKGEISEEKTKKSKPKNEDDYFL